MKQTKKKRGLLIILQIIVVLLIGALWECICEVKESNFQKVGTTCKINSHEIQTYIKGNQGQFIVFISGSATPCAYTDFYFLQESLKDYAKTISFDHAGYGWSTHTKCSRDIDTLTKELDELLSKTLNAQKYIIVAHSLGSLEALRYTQKYAEKVSAVILLDGGNPEFYKSESERNAILINRLAAVLRITGINRLLSLCGCRLPLGGENIRYQYLPSEVKKLDLIMYYKTFGISSNLANLKRMNENAKIVLENGFIKSIPLYIITVDNGDKKWNDSQKALLKWSDQSSQVILEDAEHYVHWSNQKDILDIIKEILE